MKNPVKNFGQYLKESDDFGMERGGSRMGRGSVAKWEPLGSQSILGRLRYAGQTILVPYPEDILGDDLGEYSDYADENVDAYKKWVCKFAKLYGATAIQDEDGGELIRCSDYE